MKNTRSNKHEPFGFLKKSKIHKQLYTVYILAVLLPVTLIGIFLVGNTLGLLTSYYGDLLESDNLRVRTILFEITTQVYNISEELSFNKEVLSILTGSYASEQDLMEAVNQSASSIDNYLYNYTEIAQLEIYCDNPNFYDYKQYHKVDSTIMETDWYQKASTQASIFWTEMEIIDQYDNQYWNLCLVRKIPLVGSNYNAVLVIRLSDNYLKARINSQEYRICVSVDKGSVFFATDRADYGKPQMVEIDYEQNYFQYTGNREIDHKTCFLNMSTLHLYQSDSRIYICTINDKSYGKIIGIIRICLLIISMALVFPAILIHFFTGYFTKRIGVLRHVMHQASNEDYEFEEIVRGQDEISEAFADLEVMVQKIKEKDARMYEALLNEQALINEQQRMEFKMLASQINPHFLYNTLETIRMKAYTAGDKEAATAIKLLGKSMRYVLENNGTALTKLKSELDHIEIYMKIQKLRFGDKFDYQFQIEDGIDVEACMTLPLLLQPIVENAILHGLEEKESDGLVMICIERVPSVETQTDTCIRISVSDNGCGMDNKAVEQLRGNIEQKNPERKTSIGLYNINQRVKLCYGELYGITIETEQNQGTTIILLLPEKTDRMYSDRK